MALDGAALPQSRPGLPPLSTYLRATLALGIGSLRLAIPALGFLYFYRLGMELFLSFSVDPSSSLSGYDNRTLLVSAATEMVAYIPMLVLIYTPFLPLQDALLRGERRSFMACVKLVLERLVPFVISVIAQIVLAFGPPTLVIGGLALLSQSLPSSQMELGRVAVLLAMVPCLVWVAFIALFLIYAIPYLVLERRGPLTSIRMSFGLVAQHFAGMFGRLFVFFSLLVIAAIALSMPTAIVQTWSAAAEIDHPAIRISKAIWNAGVSAILFPFSVAALIVLFRAAVPAGVTASSAMPAAPATGEEPQPPTSPFRFE